MITICFSRVSRLTSARGVRGRNPPLQQTETTAGVTDGQPWFVMELIKGVSITQYCDQGG